MDDTADTREASRPDEEAPADVSPRDLPVQVKADPDVAVQPAASLEVGGESIASVRKTFVVLFFAAAVLLLPPRQWISSIVLGATFGALGYRWRKDVDGSLTTTLACVYFFLLFGGFAADRVAAHYHWVIPY